jgi:hypothetical protein
VAELDPDMKPSRADVSTFATARVSNNQLGAAVEGADGKPP